MSHRREMLDAAPEAMEPWKRDLGSHDRAVSRYDLRASGSMMCVATGRFDNLERQYRIAGPRIDE